MNPATDLRRLRDLPDFEVADGHPDVRNWTVRGATGAALGTVHELLVDLNAQQVRYLDAELNEFGAKHILIPLERVSLDAEARNVFVPALTSAVVDAYPAYTEQLVTPAYAEAMHTVLGPLA